MKHAKKIFNILFLSLLFTLTSSASFAKDCDTCTKPQVASEMSDADLEKLSEKLEAAGGASFETKLEAACTNFKQIEVHEVRGFIDDWSETPYPIDAYFQHAVCITNKKKVGIKSPIMHLIADGPCDRGGFPQVIHKYYTVKRKNPELWKKAVNAKNTDGETLLDYLETLLRNDSYAKGEGVKCAIDVASFLCSTGAKYSKFASEKSCL